MAALNALIGKHRVRLARALVMVLAAALRFTGIGFAPGTPWGRPDEEIFAVVGLRLFATENPHVAETGWPELWFRAHHWVQEVVLAWWTMRDGEVPNLGCVLALDAPSLVGPVRVVAATLATATVWLVMRLARRVGPTTLSPDEREAVSLAAGLFYAVDVLAMRDGHFAVSDQPLIFFLAWMFLATARGLEEGRPIDFASCGLALGLAIGTKWTGLTFGLVPAIALVMRFRRFGASPANAAAVLLGVAGILVGFLGTNPTFLHTPQPFLDGIGGLAARYDPNMPQAFTIYERAPIELGLAHHLRVSLPFAFGWPLLVVALFGTLACSFGLRTKMRPITGVLAFFTVFFHVAIVGRTTMYFARYSLPEHPGLAVAAGLAVVWIARAVAARRGKPTVARPLALALTLALALEPTLRSLELDAYLCMPETRDLALARVHQLVGDEPVDVSGNYARVYGVQPQLAAQCEEMLPPRLRHWVMRLGTVPDPGPIASGRPGSWVGVADAAIMETLHRPTYSRTQDRLLLTMPYLPCDQPVNEYAVVHPPACWVEEERWDPVGIACDATWDDQDHFYAPLWGWTSEAVFAGTHAARIGPRVILYRDECHRR